MVDKSNLRYVNFHDYIDIDRYNEWKWLFNNIRKTSISLEYADELIGKVNTLTKEVETKLNDKVDSREVDIDASVTPENIDETLGVMQGIYTKNVNSISESTLDGDIKDKLNNYNVMMSELVNRVKTAMNASITVNDTELFGFGKKYETCLVSADFSEYMKASNPSKYGLDVNILTHIKHIMNRLSQVGDFFTLSPNSAIKEEITTLTNKIKLLKEGIKVLGAKTEWHKTKADSDLVDTQKYIKWNKNLLDTQKEQLADYDYFILPEVEDGTTPRSLYMSYRNLIIDAYEEIMKVRQLLKTNIREMKVMDREENTNGTYVSRSVINHKQVYDWFANQGITPVPSEELHVTISYSRAEFNHTADDKIIVIAPSQMLSIEPLGNEGCLVMKLTSDELKANFDKCMSEGATYDYDEYVPHVTIAINVPDELISGLTLPDFPIEFDAEVIEPLDLNWKDKITDTESFDAELFGFGKKYESNIISVNFRDYFKDTLINMWTDDSHDLFNHLIFAKTRIWGRYVPLINPVDKILKDEIKRLSRKIEAFKASIKKYTAKTDYHTVSPSNEFIDPKKFIDTTDTMKKKLDDGYERISEYLNKQVSKQDASESDVKIYLNMFKEVIDIIIKLRTTIKNSIREKRNNDKESFDLELFGFGVKYQSDLNYTTISEFLKNSMYYENSWELIHKAKGVFKDRDSAYDDIAEKVKAIKDNISVGTAKRSMRVIKPDSEIVDDAKYQKSLKFLDETYEKNKTYIETIEDNDKRKTALSKFNTDMYNCLKKIRTILKAGIKEVKNVDKESFDNGVVCIVSSPFEYMDTEGFQSISGLVATGFKKVSDVISGITDNMTVSKPDYANLTKGFFSKDKRYQDVYTYLVPVPAGYNGYIKDVSLYVLNNIHQINTLDSNVDNLINTLSTYINSAEYRESFAVDMSTSKAIEAIASDLYKENRKYISESKEDSRAINKLLRSANEVDDAVEYLKKADKILDLNQLESIKKKMKQVDNLVTVMIDNKNQYSKPKLLEIAKYIDAIISLSNAVGTVIYLKNSTDIILVDIKNIL